MSTIGENQPLTVCKRDVRLATELGQSGNLRYVASWPFSDTQAATRHGTVSELSRASLGKNTFLRPRRVAAPSSLQNLGRPFSDSLVALARISLEQGTVDNDNLSAAIGD